MLCTLRAALPASCVRGKMLCRARVTHVGGGTKARRYGAYARLWRPLYDGGEAVMGGETGVSANLQTHHHGYRWRVLGRLTRLL